MTFAPSREKSSATAAPMPELAPLISPIMEKFTALEEKITEKLGPPPEAEGMAAMASMSMVNAMGALASRVRSSMVRTFAIALGCLLPGLVAAQEVTPPPLFLPMGES